MTHRERFAAALEGKTPDWVPTFELEFQLEQEMFGARFDYARVTPEALDAVSATERMRALEELAAHTLWLYVDQLEYSSVPINGPTAPPRLADQLDLIRILRQMAGNTVMLHAHGDGTFALPDGNDMYAFAYRIADDFEGLKRQAQDKAQEAIARNHRLAEAGVDCFILCADYCYNQGPFISPAMFSELITPYLARIIADIRQMGCYAIKHTDGNIMPILDQLVQAHPHALHSLDPMAQVDIAQVKRLVGDRVALCGNVNCALMQTGTDEQVVASARYAIDSGKPGGGYVFCTSNVPFKGLPARRYELILDVWKRMRDYSKEEM